MVNPMAAIQGHGEVLRKLGARRVGVFGSAARGEARADSDVDVYVEFEEDTRTYNNFFALHELLEEVFGRRVGLVTDKSLSETKARLILPAARYVALDD